MFDKIMSEEEYQKTFQENLKNAIDRGDMHAIAFLSSLWHIHQDIQAELGADLEAIRKERGE